MSALYLEYSRDEQEQSLSYLVTRLKNATRPKVKQRLTAAVERLERHLYGGHKGKQSTLF